MHTASLYNMDWPKAAIKRFKFKRTETIGFKKNQKKQRNTPVKPGVALKLGTFSVRKFEALIAQ